MSDETRKLIDECLASSTPLALQLAATAYIVEAKRLLDLAMKLQRPRALRVVKEE